MGRTLAALLLAALAAAAPAAPPLFPVAGEMRGRVAFWKRVYTEITSRQAFVHDSEDVTIVYRKVAAAGPGRARRRAHAREKARVAGALRGIARKNYKGLTPRERAVAAVVGRRRRADLLRLARGVRVQTGLRDRYYRGLVRSHAWLPHIRRIHRRMGLPEELAYLPHVESSFNTKAHSKAGAAGIWQFMGRTARHYGLRMSRAVDERRDVLKSTRAAARLLRDNHRSLKSWPLALTAYNHGVRSMRRAVGALGTRDINAIVEGYRGPRFGFASKNFYATFMATVEISRDPGRHFPSFRPPPAASFSTVRLEGALSVAQVRRATGLSEGALRRHNPAIRPAAYRAPLLLPGGFDLRVPKAAPPALARHRRGLRAAGAAAASARRGRPRGRRTHVVKRGENLHGIARMHRVALADIIHANGLTNPSRIHPGDRLRIPARRGRN